MQSHCYKSCIDTSDTTTTNTIPAHTKDTTCHTTPYPFVICLGSSTGIICTSKGELGWEAISLFEADKTCVDNIASQSLLAFKTHGTAVLLLPHATVRVCHGYTMGTYFHNHNCNCGHHNRPGNGYKTIYNIYGVTP